MATPTSLLALFFLLSFCFAGIVTSEDEDCVYTVYVRTGSIFKGGTDSIIGLKLYDSYGYGIYIKNLELWGGLMGPDYNYYERGNLDIFSGKGPCLEGPVCAVNLTSDGSGPHHGWYCNYVEVTSTGVHIPCAQQQFEVEQWLATDTSPYELSAVRNYCPNDLSQTRHKLKIVDSIRSGSGSRSDFSILS
ncbi:putative PLAT/LH2 domain-containing protein [Medicago truncatula]|uniref:PLAT-plant-stress protein n=1 Tax=Medicago truncatula TaxID=3880 RepID=G7J3U7_MEDTR|nr:PLAT domain-containing protein 3 isoform X1 [Medicago truncatula]AES72232.1 PLAT-plant-stress protein [Medicago truncatula]RHN69395.1 putative PLAT/LH2 domain-containing protein [Medicago truncatula]